MVTIRSHTLGFTLTRACPPCEASKEAGEDGAEEREGEEEQEAGHQQGGQQVHCQVAVREYSRKYYVPELSPQLIRLFDHPASAHLLLI